MHHNVLARIAAPLLGAALIATGLVTPAAGAGDDLAARPQTAAGSTSRTSAEALLDQALAVKNGARAKTAGATPLDLTMLLRDLKVAQPSLSPADRAVAQRLFARPTDDPGDTYLDYSVAEEQPVCGTHVCVHYVASTADAATADDVQQTLDVMEHVWGVYAKAGYKSPKGDGTRGGSGKFDVYLGKIADQFLYGYCTVDGATAKKTMPAYCVLDNNFAEFTNHTPQQNRQVTAAHEFFHAIQFNYDYLEDPWFMEVTSTWAEDELYDNVNDNVQYLAGGQIGLPNWSLDLFENGGTYHYGNWIWLRYLTEKFPKRAGGLPVIVRTMWRKAGDNMYSIQAISSVLKSEKTSFAKEYALFAAKNRFASKFYDEGKAEGYPSAPHAAVGTLPENSYTAWLTAKIAHQASASYKVTPSRVSSIWKLQVNVKGPVSSHSPMAVVDQVTKKGKHVITVMHLNKKGDGSVKVPFANAKTKQVVVTLVNAGTNYKQCSRTNPTTWYACGGVPQDDGKFQIKFQVVKH
ncbi:MAG: MXAN_6640 family putative metalloprotease [Nocardioidaceae bacterium]